MTLGGAANRPAVLPLFAECVELGVPFFLIDTSAHVTRRYPPELVDYMRSRSGRRKVMFGTNYPMLLHQQALEHLDELGLDDEARELFLGGNAERIGARRDPRRASG